MAEECKRTDCKGQPLSTVLCCSYCWQAIEYGLCPQFKVDLNKAVWSG